MRTPPSVKFTRVLRRPRREWTIPAIDEQERLNKQRAYEAELKLRFRGTTPYGREIFRRMLHRAWKLCEQNHPNAMAVLESELAAFPELREEFIRLTSRLEEEPSEERWKELEEESQGVSLVGVAGALILRSGVAQKFDRDLASGADMSHWLNIRT